MLKRILTALAFVVLLVGSAAAATLNDANAALAVGDYATALRVARPLAEQGVAAAQNILGLLYQYGRGVRRSDVEAAKWFRLAAERGFALGQANIGVMYEHGRGVSRDYGEAVKWYRLAAEQGLARAQSNLATMCFEGSRPPRDAAEAAKWWTLAAALGEREAEVNLSLAAAQMTKGQIAEGRRRARAWLEKYAS
jgi:TPR repeat protein